MNVLVINGDCIKRNSSANLCHLAYINGLVQCGHNVSILSADENGYTVDDNMVIPSEVKQYSFKGISLYEKMSLRKTRTNAQVAVADNSSTPQKPRLVTKLKRKVLSLYGVHGIYTTFVRKAKKFKSSEHFDYVISVSTPPSGHLLAHKLLKSGNIKADKWIQIWEDPWYSDAYGFNNKEKIRKEEQRLLSFAQHVCYVSPFTLKRQQELYPESAHKMFWHPLPYYYKEESLPVDINSEKVYGYFGDYVPVARDLSLFYQAAKELNVTVNICGNPSNLFQTTDKINIYPRMPLKELKNIENVTNVLVFLCNKQGGQIPGKIYQYSATNKIILFILDGTEEEKNTLKEYFGGFNRYVFCDNTVESIKMAINAIESNSFNGIENAPLEYFAPQNIVEKILTLR